MMNDQEMQFADPEWRPRQGQNNTYAEVESQPYNPLPINDDRLQREQPQWEETPERAYKAQELPPYQAPPVMGSQYRYGPVRRSRSPWALLIVVLIIFSLLGGMIGVFGVRRSAEIPPVMQGFPAQQHAQFAQPNTFKVDTQNTPTIVINSSGGGGDILVQAGADPGEVTVQSDGQNPVVTPSSLDILNINMTDSDITVTVPNNVNLIITGDGNVNVDNVSGQMTLTSTGGDVTMHGDILTGNSTIKSGDGDITFDGQLDRSGSYQFISSTGSVNLTLSADSAFSLNATAPNGSIETPGFSQVQVQQTGNGATAHGSVGNAPRATLTITTGSGDISLSAR